MLMVDLEEKNEKILRQFYEHPPLIIQSIDRIRSVSSDCIMLNTYDRLWINFPVCPNSSRFQPANWLHEQLMIINDRCRKNWKEQGELHRRQKFQQAREEENTRFFAILTSEKENYEEK
ncbi:unnamed protein product [Adineta steineri]|uniref:Uncharacterized protein n=1 Tax=Adineta steineri TaxID=433720 RepID=A0A819RHC5_9BILA|nr:unnamed protein product [Adineta steineri]CAF1207946.1 unnamed protein product [Adineta steineri]CAF3933865.1 unnamed protein product [Adineta steineri]CAF4040711.1 unnamed protein product [Adineta steineri]